MTGCKPLTPEEITTVLINLTGPMALRDQALFILGTKTGFRVAELLSLKVSDVRENGQMLDRVQVARRNTKGKHTSRSVALHPDAAKALKAWIDSLDGPAADSYLFFTHRGINKPLTTRHAWRVLNAAFKAAGITGNTGTHSMRKTFAMHVYNALDKNLLATQRALGHKSLLSTACYLSFEDDEQIDAAVLSA